MNLHAKPGSVVWLLKWDLIQLWNWLGTTSERRIGKRYAWLSRLLLLVLLHMPALLILLLPAPERRSDDVKLAIDIAMTFLACMLFLSMTFMAIYTAVTALGERKYTELVLTSPLPERTLGRWFIASNAMGTLVGFPLFVLPFVNVLVCFGKPQALLVYLSIAGYALTAASIGVLVAFGLQRLLGPARAKRYVGLIGIVLLLTSGVVISLGMNMLKAAQLTPQPWHKFVAGTVAGEWLPTLVVLLLGLALWLGLARFAARGVKMAAETQVVAAAPLNDKPLRFEVSPVRALLNKEWRLMLRYPMLAMNLANPVMMLIFPLMHVLEGKGAWHEALDMTVAFSGGMAAMTAHSLCWAASALDESPALLWSAPMQRERWRRWQLLAGLLPTWLAMLPVLAIVAWVAPLKAVGLAVVAVAAGIGGGLLAQSFYRPVAKHERNMQYGMRTPQVIIMMLYGAAWGGVSTALNGFALGLVLLPFVLGLPAWLLMRMEDREYLYD
ncbi:hypothetical protein QWZ03_12760 [Chitinimonas viridis]|uniref:ABC transporter permease n=1 Tax=Chitinimonas viridis TaxID=664880 RepID=A0ABT8B5V6_9NEIS|nr:hypothetical protein [Chitinimonas viridis]MDN3577643.1 hypothetical protein [Chitinimonas viridis]